MSKQKNELVVKNSFEISSELMGEFAGMGLGAGDNVSNEDIIIPKIMLAQQLSEAVKEGLAKAGEFVNSVENTLLAEKGGSLEFIVLNSYKVLRVFKMVKNKKEYVETLDYIGNEHLPIDETIDGVEYHRDRVIAFYVLLVDEIKSGMPFPYIIDFTRSSARAGKQLQTYFAKMRSVGIPSFGKVFTLSAKYIQEEHDYYVKEVSAGRSITSEELVSIKLWLKNIEENKHKMKEDDSDLKTEQDINASYTVKPEATSGKPKF
jgi:hypothetical protein